MYAPPFCKYMELTNASSSKYKPQAWLDDAVLMQSTGLCDKNGKEIFEGDIVRHEEWHGGPEHAQADHEASKEGRTIDWTNLYIVIWDTSSTNGQWAMDNPEREQFRGYVEGEVVGNIYEDANLLKE